MVTNARVPTTHQNGRVAHCARTYTIQNCKPQKSISACTEAAPPRLRAPRRAPGRFPAWMLKPRAKNATKRSAGAQIQSGANAASPAPTPRTTKGTAQSASRPYAWRYLLPENASALSSLVWWVMKASDSKSLGSTGSG